MKPKRKRMKVSCYAIVGRLGNVLYAGWSSKRMMIRDVFAAPDITWKEHYRRGWRIVKLRGEVRS